MCDNLKPKISIIIPVFNAEDDLSNTIDSIINQDIGFEFLEIIIIDDKSTDNSKSIIQSYENKYENIMGFYLEKNNGTPGKLRNIGINNATSDYIMFCDSDDSYSKDYCKTMLDAVLKYPKIDFVSSRYNLINQDKFIGLNKSFLEDYSSLIKVNNINEFKEIIYTLSNLSIWNKIFKKEFILRNNIKFYDNRWDEDFFFSINCFIKSTNGFILLNDYAGYNYKIDDLKNPSNNRLKNSINDTVLCFQDLKELLCEEINVKNLDFEKIISEHIITSTQYFLGNSLSKQEQIELLDKMKPYYKNYKINNKLVNKVSLPLNILINIFIKLCGLSNNFTIFCSNLYKKFI